MPDSDVIPMATLPGLIAVRNFLTPVRLDRAARAAAESDTAPDLLGTMDVRYSSFGDWYEIDSWWEGQFLERTMPGAFARTINEHNDPANPHDMKTLFNHGMDFSVGDKLLGSIVDAREESDSPVNTVELWDTSYNRDLLPGLRVGAYGSSFMFTVTRDDWNYEPGVSDHNPDGIPERTIRETRTFEAGPVTWPANPSATAAMNSGRPNRSGTDRLYEDMARKDRDSVQRMRDDVIALRSAGRLLSPGRLPGAGSTIESTGSHTPPDGPVDVPRSAGMSAAARQRYLRMRSLDNAHS